MGKHHWKVEKQPEWYVKAVRKTIAKLPGGYAEAADWLDVTENALFNRLRADGDQIFPLGWAMILQRAGGTHFIADAVAQSANGVFVSLPDVEDVDNADINQRLLEVIEQIGSYSKQIRSAIEDGVVEPHEKTAINDELYLSISKLQEHAALVYKIFAFQKVMTPASVQLRAPWRVVTVEKLTHEQFNNTLPSLATDCASCTRWKSEGGVLLCSKCTGGRVIVTHSFAEWAVGDFNRQKETVLCDKLTAGSKITTEYPSESFVGSRKHNGLSTSAKAMSMNASVRSNSFVVNSGK